MLDAVGISGEEVCCSVLFSTLVDVSVFSVIWLLMTYAISWPLWSSVYECQRVQCAFTSPVRVECGMLVMSCMQCICLCRLFCSAWICCAVRLSSRRIYIIIKRLCLECLKLI